ncbi:MAG: GntR family transcriptional regulator [Paracoccaceae bacterium]|nr:GntR family transcriptional regulator [Paracoccaceae bacterium]
MVKVQQNPGVEATSKKATSLENALKKLRSAIEDGRLPPGIRLPEEKLARALDTPRARVREVLARLANERLVVLQVHRGAFVTRPTVEEARNICEARLMVERTMARFAAERTTEQELKKMRGLVEQERAAWDAGNVRLAATLSLDFHRAIADAVSNPVLEEILANLLSRSALTQAVHAARCAAACLCDDHTALLDAIEAGDADRTEALMVEHIQNLVSRLDLEPLSQDVDIEDALRNKL